MSFYQTKHIAFGSTYHTVLKASPGTAIIGQDMLVEILFRLVFILAGALFYGTVTIQKKLGFLNTGSFAPKNEGQV